MLIKELDEFKIRKLDIDDIPEIMDIYETITGETSPNEGDLESKMDYGDSLLCLGAEKEGKLIGFIFGETRRGEYGEIENIGWIDLLGVHPEYRKLGIGRELGNELLNQFSGIGVKKVRTTVTNQNTSLLKFFMNLGLKPADWTILEYEAI